MRSPNDPAGSSDRRAFAGLRAVVAWAARRPFLRFAAVGVAAYLVDTAILAVATQGFGMGPYGGRAISLAVATIFAWYGNRRLTFRESAARSGHKAVAAEVARAVTARAISVLINYGIYAAMVALAPLPFNNPYLAVVTAGAITMVMNFQLMKLFVFNQKPDD